MHLPDIILDWPHTYRVIPSKFPPINFFEKLVDAELMEALFYVESLTNDRLRDEVGNIFLVPREDRVCGNGSSVVMAAFTHISKDHPSRFSDGSFGIYYAARQLETALREKAYHSEKFLRYTNEAAGSLTMRVYQSKGIRKSLRDLRGESKYHHPTHYTETQSLGLMLKAANEWGLVYNSLRHPGGECVAILRPPAIPLPVIQTQHFNFEWNGDLINHAIEIGGQVFAL